MIQLCTGVPFMSPWRVMGLTVIEHPLRGAGVDHVLVDIRFSLLNEEENVGPGDKKLIPCESPRTN